MQAHIPLGVFSQFPPLLPDAVLHGCASAVAAAQGVRGAL